MLTNILCDVEVDVLTGKIGVLNFRPESTPFAPKQIMMTELLGTLPGDWNTEPKTMEDLQCYRFVADGTIDEEGVVTCNGVFTRRTGLELELLPRRKDLTIKEVKENANTALTTKYPKEMDKILGLSKKLKTAKQSDFDDDIDTVKGFVETKEDEIDLCVSHEEVLLINVDIEL